MAKPRDPALLRRLGARFRSIRLARGRTQEEVAAALGLQAPTVSRWETGRVGLSLPVLAKAAVYFKVSLGDLVGEDRELPDSQYALVSAWTSLTAEQRRLVFALIEQLAAGNESADDALP